MSNPSDHAPLECDLVMKGGITSGIVYPGAIAAIAADYRIRSIGGTSAGAIGAGAAAAMEFGRRSGRNPGARERLAGLASDLGRDAGGVPLLRRLFEPDRSTAGLFRLVLRVQAAAQRSGTVGVLSVLFLRALLMATLLASLAVGLLLWREPAPSAPHQLTLLLLFVTGVPILTLSLFFFGPLRAMMRDLAAVEANGFGFCSGKARATVKGAELPSLVGWLHARFQELSGLPDDEPLTFGDLWTASQRTASVSRKVAFEAARKLGARDADDRLPPLSILPRDVELVLVASDVNRAQSVQLPFMRRDDLFYASITDLLALFPRTVVDWMVGRQRAVADGRDRLSDIDLHGLSPDDLVRLPRPEDMPILVGVRMSLSFPFLFRAVRLYVIRRKSQGSPNHELAELWLADGGITSNFPLHLFDSPVPGRPTFCLNLLYHDDELQPEGVSMSDDRGEGDEPGLGGADAPLDELVYMLRDNRARLAAYTRFGEGSGISRLLRFGGRVITTARQWGDNQLIDVPGYRDRIVHVRMRSDEGGFNFDMDAGKIDDLQARGTRAGTVIATRFRPDVTEDPLHPGQRLVLNWANHRFVRLRSFLAGLEVAASRFTEGWAFDRMRAELPRTDPLHLSPGLEQMIEAAGTSRAASLQQQPGYPFANQDQRDLALATVQVVGDLAGLAGGDASVNGVDFVNGRSLAPKPKQSLRLRPFIDSDPLAERP